MERKYVSKNGVVERTRYVVGDRATPRNRKRNKSTLRKEEQNFNSAIRRVARILNCNFDSSAILLTLDYSPEGMGKLCASLPEPERIFSEKLSGKVGAIGAWTSHENGKRIREREEEKENEKIGETFASLREAAEHQFILWFRRIKRKVSERIKMLAVTSDIDHETGELVRLHHHVVLQGEGLSWDLIRKEWKLGSMDIRQLRNQPDYTPIAVYLMRQVRQQPDKKKYRVSRGMEMPEMTEREVLGRAEMKAPAGATVFERGAFSTDNVTQYIRYLPRPRKRRKNDEFSKIQGDPPEL